MRCNVCGKENPDNVDFCVSCGGTLSGSSKPSVPVTTWESDFTEYFRTAWRQFARSPLAIAYVLCYCACVVVTFLNWNAAISELYQVLGSAGFWNMTTLPHANVILTVVHLIEMLPTALMTVGILMVFIDAWTRSNQPIRLGGLTLTLTVEIVYMVLLAMVLGLVLIKARGAFFALLLVVGLIIYLQWLKVAVNLTVRNALRDCAPEARYVKALAVLEFISAGVHFIRLIGGAGEELNSVLNCIATLLLGILLLKYRELMENLDAKRVEMEAQQETVPVQTEAVKEEAYVPAWKRVQMEKENKEN